MKNYDCIIWDFNGTIFNDVNIGIESINVLLKRRGLKEISDINEYRESFGFPIVEWYKHLGFDFEREDYDVVANEWVREYLSREKEATLVNGVRTALQYFYDKGIRQVIISASEINMLKRQLSFLGIENFFDNVVGKNDVYASGKEEIAKRWRENNPGEMIFIGDTDHDLATAEAMNVDCTLVACGHQSYDRLTALKETAKVNCVVLADMKSIVKI